MRVRLWLLVYLCVCENCFLALLGMHLGDTGGQQMWCKKQSFPNLLPIIVLRALAHKPGTPKGREAPHQCGEPSHITKHTASDTHIRRQIVFLHGHAYRYPPWPPGGSAAPQQEKWRLIKDTATRNAPFQTLGLPGTAAYQGLGGWANKPAEGP